MSRKIDTVFVLALVTLFAITSFVLVLIGAKQYRFVTDTMNENYEDRTASSYLTEKIRQFDNADSVYVTKLDTTSALALRAAEDGILYTTYIYYYEGSLRELVITENSVYDLSLGQEILPMQSFSPSLVTNTLLCIELADSTGTPQTLYLAIHCGAGKEAQ